MKVRLCILILLTGALLCTACGGKPASNPSSMQATSPTSPSQTDSVAPTEIPPTSLSTTTDASIPKACALLTAADVEKITGYGGGLADSQDMGADGTACTITTPDTKFRVQLSAGHGVMPPLPGEKTLDLEGGAKGIVKNSGIGDQGWTSIITMPDYTVTTLISGTAITLDPDKKIADVTKADGSKITFAQTYEAIARAIAHNAASGAQMPSEVSEVSATDDPCGLLTLDEVKAVMSEFEMTGPESGPSAFGGNICRFRGHSDSLKVDAIVGVVYLTRGQFEQGKLMGTGKTFDIGGTTAYDTAGGALMLNKGAKYVRFSIDLLTGAADTLEQQQAGLGKWLPALAEKIAAKM